MACLNQKSSLTEKAMREADIESLHRFSLEQQAFFTFLCAGDQLEDLAEVRGDPWYKAQMHQINQRYRRIVAML